MTNNDWVITDALVEWLKANLPEGKTILELGSGEGTAKLVRYWKVNSIEHDSKFIGVVKESHYIYAPLTPFKEIKRHGGGSWYDRRVLTSQLSSITYDLLLVDGPCPPGNRAGIIKYYDLFNCNVPWVFDDINRGKDWNVILSMQHRLKRTITVPYDTTGKTFGVI